MRQRRPLSVAMPLMAAPKTLHTAFLAFVLAVFTVAAAVLAASPASAHDVAESSAPANGASVATVPGTVSVTFNNNPLGLGAQFLVNDSNGTNWADGPVEIVDNVVSQKVRAGAPAGKFTVVWRVVSSDSHPIEGSFTFTATSGETTTATGSATAVPSPQVPTVGTAQPGAGQGGTSGGTPADASEPFPWSIVGFALVALALLAFLGVTARRRLGKGEDEVGSDEA